MSQKPATNRGFAGNAAVMMGGTALAQAIPILVSPVLTRIYSPEQFGALTAFVGVVTILGVAATLRLEPAIVLPENDSDAVNVAAAALGIAISTVTLIFAASLLSMQWISQRWPSIETGIWLPLVAPMVLCLAVAQVASSWANRTRRYGVIATAMVAQQGGTAIVSVALGLAGVTGVGLVVGRFVGQLASAAWLSAAARFDWRVHAAQVSVGRMRSIIGRYRKFPTYNLPYSLIGTLSREFLVFALTIFHLTQHAGYYGLARSVLYAPVSFLSSSLSQVFYKEAAESIGTPAFAGLAERLLRVIVLVFTPAFVTLTIWGPDLFAFVFGAEWRQAGLYAAIFAPAAYLFLFSSWPERLFDVTGRQRLSLVIQVAFDSLAVLVVMVFLWQGRDPIPTLVAYTLVTCAYHCAYMTAAFTVAGFEKVVLWRAVRLASFVATTSAILAFACRALGPRVGLVAATVATAVYTLAVLAWLLRWRSSHAGTKEGSES